MMTIVLPNLKVIERRTTITTKTNLAPMSSLTNAVRTCRAEIK